MKKLLVLLSAIMLMITAFTVPSFASTSQYIKDMDPSDWGNPKDWNWSMTCHDDNPYPLLYNSEAYNGTVTHKDGSVEYAGLGIYRDTHPSPNIQIYIIDENNNLITNKSGADMNINMRFSYDEDRYKDTTMIMNRNDYIISYTPRDLNYEIEGALMNEEEAFYLDLTFPNGDRYNFCIPENQDYLKAWTYVSDRWYIPMYSDTIYTGDDVNPDLVAFIEDYDAAFQNVVNSIIGDGSQLSLNRVINFMENSREYAPLQEMFSNLTRKSLRMVDFDYIESYKKYISDNMAEAVTYGFAEGISEVIHEDHPILGGLFDLAVGAAGTGGGLDIVSDLFSSLIFG